MPWTQSHAPHSQMGKLRLETRMHLTRPAASIGINSVCHPHKWGPPTLLPTLCLPKTQCWDEDEWGPACSSPCPPRPYLPALRPERAGLCPRSHSTRGTDLGPSCSILRPLLLSSEPRVCLMVDLGPQAWSRQALQHGSLLFIHLPCVRHPCSYWWHDWAGVHTTQQPPKCFSVF